MIQENPLPITVPPIAHEPRPGPASREELVQLVASIGARCKMPPSIKKAQFVRLPADLFERIRDVVERELDSIMAQSEAIAAGGAVVGLVPDETHQESSREEAPEHP